MIRLSTPHRILSALTLIAAFLVAGSLGSAFGLYLALPDTCLTRDNLTRYTPECRAAIDARNAARVQS